MWKKIASIAGLLSSAMLVSSCQTPMYKPIVCDTGTALNDGRCQKVPRIIKKPTPVRPAPGKKAGTISTLDQRVQPPRQNVYGTAL